MKLNNNSYNKQLKRHNGKNSITSNSHKRRPSDQLIYNNTNIEELLPDTTQIYDNNDIINIFK